MGVGGGADGFEPLLTSAPSSSSSSETFEAGVSSSSSSQLSTRGAGAGFRGLVMEDDEEEEVLRERAERVLFRSVRAGLAGLVGGRAWGCKNLSGFVRTWWLW